MPLIKSTSTKAREENIKTEIAAGKSPKQAVAIGYSEQRRAAARGSKKPATGDSKAKSGHGNKRERDGWDK